MVIDIAEKLPKRFAKFVNWSTPVAVAEVYVVLHEKVCVGEKDWLVVVTLWVEDEMT